MCIVFKLNIKVTKCWKLIIFTDKRKTIQISTVTHLSKRGSTGFEASLVSAIIMLKYFLRASKLIQINFYFYFTFMHD